MLDIGLLEGLFLLPGRGFCGRLCKDCESQANAGFLLGQRAGCWLSLHRKVDRQGYEVTGSVRNLPDGRVELVAEGARDELEAFRQAIRDSGLDHFIRDESELVRSARTNFAVSK